MFRAVILSALLFSSVSAIEKELQVVFTIERMIALGDGSIWELVLDQDTIDFAPVEEIVTLSDAYANDWEERCFLDRHIYLIDRIENKKTKKGADMAFVGYTDFHKKVIVKQLLDERTITSGRAASQKKMTGAFLEDREGGLYLSAYAPFAKEDHPIHLWMKEDIVLEMYRNSSHFFFLNLTRGDVIETDKLGVLSPAKTLSAVHEIQGMQVLLEGQKPLVCLAGDGEDMLSWRAGDEVIIRFFSTITSSLDPEVKDIVAAPLAFIHNVAKNKAIIVQALQTSSH